MKSTKHTADLLDKLSLPPTSRDMRGVVQALVEDDALDAATTHADRMLDHFTKHDQGDHVEQFYYWLGVLQTVRTIRAARQDRQRVAADRRYRSAIRKSLASISHLERKA